MTDQELITKMSAGCETSFNELYSRYHPRVFAVAYRVVRDKNDAEEATQDAFISLYRKGHQYRGDSKVSHWLLMIARNSALMKLRDAKRVKRLSLDDYRALTPTSVSGSLELSLDIQRALLKIPRNARRLLSDQPNKWEVKRGRIFRARQLLRLAMIERRVIR